MFMRYRQNTVSRVLFQKSELTEFCGKLGQFCDTLGEFALELAKPSPQNLVRSKELPEFGP